MNTDDKLLCPSYRCVSGALLLGVVQGDGKVVFIGEPQPIDRTFVEIAGRGRPPEVRFRFAHTCGEGACANFGGGHCTLASHLAAQAGAADDGALPECAIRRSCRWYAEQSGAACRVCTSVVRGSEAVLNAPPA